jgi:WG containing repeat
MTHSPPADALIPYRRGEQWGYADAQRAIVVACDYEQTFPFSGQPVAHVRRGGRSGLIDATGRLVLPLDYDWVGDQLEGHLREPDGTMVVERAGKFGFVDAQGAVLVEPTHDSAVEAAAHKPTGAHEHGAESNESDESDESASWRLPEVPAQLASAYDHVRPLSEDLYAVVSQGLWGLVDSQGATLAACAFAAFGLLAEDRLPAANPDGLWGYLDGRGREVLAPAYDQAADFEQGLAVVARLNEAKSAPLRRMGLPGGVYDYGFVDLTGREAIPLRYRLARGFEGDLAWVETADTQQGGYVDRRGVEYFED